MQEFSNFSIFFFDLLITIEKFDSFRLAKVTNFLQLLPIIGKYVAS